MVASTTRERRELIKQMSKENPLWGAPRIHGEQLKGLVPKQESTGDRTILGKISKRGNKYLRTLFVQAAHVVLARRPSAAMRGLWPWIEQASRRLHRNMLAIALANKLARIAWAVLARGRAYQPSIVAI